MPNCQGRSCSFPPGSADPDEICKIQCKSLFILVNSAWWPHRLVDKTPLSLWPGFAPALERTLGLFRTVLRFWIRICFTRCCPYQPWCTCAFWLFELGMWFWFNPNGSFLGETSDVVFFWGKILKLNTAWRWDINIIGGKRADRRSYFCYVTGQVTRLQMSL